jgi:hypothetical protein
MDSLAASGSSDEEAHQVISSTQMKSNATGSSSSTSPPPVANSLVVDMEREDSVARDADPAIINDKCSSPQIITAKGVTSKSNKRKRTSKTKVHMLINLVKQKSTVKSPMFMNSTSSIFAAVCKCNSLLQTLSDDTDTKSQNSIFAIVDEHFGSCPVFKQNFEATLAAFSNISSATTDIIEQALHRSVRHLCSKECFLRAYLPIREYCMLCRDITIHESIGRTKEQLLHEWRCRLVPPTSQPTRQTKASDSVDNIAQDSIAIETVGSKQKRKNATPIVYVSPSGTEYSTKTSIVKFMNRNYCNNNLETTPSKHASPIIMKVKSRAPSKNRIVSPTKCSGQHNALIHYTTKLNPLFSPLGLLEELFVNDPWRLLVSTICLNVTTRGQVDCVLSAFLERWPTAEATANADWEEVSAVVLPLGLGTKRAKGLVRFSAEYIELTKDRDAFCLNEKQVTSLFFCGKYSWSAYNIFICKELPSGAVRVCDHALQSYVEYQLGRRRE